MDVNTYIMTPIQSAAVYTSVDRIVLFRTSQQIKNENFRKMSEKRTNEKSTHACICHTHQVISDHSWFLMHHERREKKPTNQQQYEFDHQCIATMKYSSRHYHHVTLLSNMVLLPYNGINRLTGYCFFLCWYLAYCLPCLQFAFTMYMLIYSVCERMRAERSYCFIQVCSSVENMSICTIDSSDLNWKLLRSMHILRVLVVHFFIYLLFVISRCARQRILCYF